MRYSCSEESCLMGLLFRDNIALTEVRHYMYDPLYSEEYEYLRFACDKRCCEFITVRHCARRSLQKLGLQRPVMVPGDHGEPVWPGGVVGSITHCQGYYAAAAAMSSNVATVGIDAERNHPLADHILELIASEDEKLHLRSIRDSRPDVAFDRLLFCIKECVYKAWFPLEKTQLSFHDIVVSISWCGRFKVAIPSSSRQCDRVFYRGRWRREGNIIVAALSVPFGCWRTVSCS